MNCEKCYKKINSASVDFNIGSDSRYRCDCGHLNILPGLDLDDIIFEYSDSDEEEIEFAFHPDGREQCPVCGQGLQFHSEASHKRTYVTEYSCMIMRRCTQEGCSYVVRENADIRDEM